MAELTWQKTSPAGQNLKHAKSSRLKFMIGGVVLLGAILFLIINGTMSGAQYFITIEELVNDPAYLNQTVRVTGAVVGDTIVYDTANLNFDFEIAHIPSRTDNLAYTLYLAANNPDETRLFVHVENQVKPDLLQHEAQAILTGVLREDGVFYASEVLMKCPSRYEESVPVQAQ